MNILLKACFALIVGVVTVWSFMIMPSAGFQEPQLARIFVWHFPCPMIAVVMLWLSGWFAFKQLRTGKRHWDERAAAANELAYLFSLLTMATGMLFSKMEWGAWWQWDPRQTSFLLVLLIYGAYFAVRNGFSDPERRAYISSAYALAAIIPSMFLIFVFPRLPQVQSFHPSDSIMKGQIKGEYAYVVMTVMVLLFILSAWLYRLRVNVGLLEIKKDEGLAPNSSDPTPSGVVRRVSLPS